MGWWITLGVLVLLSLLPLGISVKYDSEGSLVRVILGPVKFCLPKKEKKDKNKEDLEKLGNAIRTGASVVTSIPHFAAFGLGAGTSALANLFLDQLKGKK